jgi:predicted MFS family arabinose efflux permease
VSLSAGTVLMILMMFGFFGALFFVTFYLQNVRGMSPVSAGVHLLPMTAMLIVGSPIAGLVIGRIGPRIPIVFGMLCTAAAMFGMSALHAGTSTGLLSLWFVMLGLGLSPVIVGATEIIVGNAPVELAGVAGGLQQSAMQVGGTLGTAVLGAVMAAKVDSVLPGKWAAAKLPAVSAQDYAGLKQAVQVGTAPIAKGTPTQTAQAITQVAHDSFLSGMSLAFTVAAVVAVLAAAVGLLTKRGSTDSGPAVHI